jgi:hypothetical protein
MFISYSTVIGYMYSPIIDIYVNSGNPFDRANQSCDHVLAVPADHVLYNECCLADVFTPVASAFLSNECFTV